MTFDPKTALSNCETLMLDMDGTILDLAFDNYMWLTHVPECWAEKNGLTLSEARKRLFAKYGQVQGELYWYCLDHWSERLELDVMQLHRDNHERIEYLPGARNFLAALRDAGTHENVFILAGVGPLASAKSAEWIRNNVPGVHIPDAVIGRLRGADDQAQEGVNLCVEMINELQEIDGVHGVHIMAFRQEHRVAEIVERSGVLGDREPWRPRHEWEELAPSSKELAHV